MNIFLGLVVLLVSVLLLLALATYHAADPSLNTAAGVAGPHTVRNWTGLFGAYAGDLLLQTLGLTSFLIPLWMGGLGWTWMRSRPSGSVLLRWAGTLLALAFVPAVFGLLPWHWRWMHVLPVEGVVGRLMSGWLVSYLNMQGSWIVAAVLACTGLYFASAVSFSVLKESVEDRWLQARSLYDRWRNWREERAERKQEQERGFELEDVLGERPVAQKLGFAQAATAGDPEANEEDWEQEREGFFKRLFNRRKRGSEADDLDEVPAFKRAPLGQSELEQNDLDKKIEEAKAGAAAAGAAAAKAEEIPITPPVRRSIWESATPETDAAAAAPAKAAETQPKVVPMRPAAVMAAAESIPAAQRPAPVRAESAPVASPASAAQAASEIAIHGRADAEIRTATVAPKNVSGFKLPPSTLLNAGEGPQKVREDELREEAKVLVEKCGEFDVRGQVVQINPGPMVTTYEFKPEAGVKYSRVTGLADDLCLAMRAESILIERMAGKSTVGIQVPNHERETIHLRDVLESETFAKSKTRLTIAMGKDINGRIVTADLASMPHVLIAGSTGSGKSVAINAMIMSLLYPHHSGAGAVDPG